MGNASKPTQGTDQPQPDSGLTTRTTPGPRSRSSGGRMRPTLSVLRARRGPDPGLDTVADDLRACLQPKLTASCMNPDCSKKCKWPDGRGRPPLFHDRLCHEKYHLIRRRLVAEIADIDQALERQPRPPSEERIFMENQLARRRWLLLRYPDLSPAAPPSASPSTAANSC